MLSLPPCLQTLSRQWTHLVLLHKGIKYRILEDYARDVQSLCSAGSQFQGEKEGIESSQLDAERVRQVSWKW